MTTKRTFAFLASLALVFTANFANAAEGDAPADAPAAPTPEWTFPGSVSLASEYIFRGLTQTNKDPALQGGIEFDAARDIAEAERGQIR